MEITYPMLHLRKFYIKVNRRKFASTEIRIYFCRKYSTNYENKNFYYNSLLDINALI